MLATPEDSSELDSPIVPGHQDGFLQVPNGVGVPDQPTTLGPVFDPDHLGAPLPAWNPILHASIYGPCALLDSETATPERPEDFSEKYLTPTLAHNEHARLTMLWYHTRDLHNDAAFFKKLTDILNMVKSSLNWDFAIMGFVEAHEFQRLAAVNVPLAILPRRESPCSHTINQQPGTVFTIQDTQKDWRFMQSPQVEVGIRSYAGTPLRLILQNGDVVAFGSLCVASKTVVEPLSGSQKQTLISAADIITGELVARTRFMRSRERATMGDVLKELRSKGQAQDLESVTIYAIQARFPTCRVMCTRPNDGMIAIEGQQYMPLANIRNGHWEDTAFLKAHLQCGGCEQCKSDRPVRAVVGYITPHDRLLVVVSSEKRLVFDDLDTWFLEQCAQIINAANQARALRDALAAKETFLRSITHELRTPLHGILSSVELLSEELRSRNISGDDNRQQSPSEASVDSFLQTIRNSGTDLMTTINNILRLNVLSNSNTASSQVHYDIQNLEDDVLDEILGSYDQDRLGGLSVRFDNSRMGSTRTIIVDADQLKELMKCLVSNAVDATIHGSITVTTSLTADQQMLRLDVQDNGRGIDAVHHDRIFLPFEKVDSHARGAGLGLSLAAQMAANLKGTLTLVRSQLGNGSHFRVEIPQTVSESATNPTRRTSSQSRYTPSKYYVIQNSDHDLHLLSHFEAHLLDCGLQKSDVAQDSLILMNLGDPTTSSRTAELSHLDGQHTILLLCDDISAQNSEAHLSKHFKNHFFRPVVGPFYTARLNELLKEVDLGYAAHQRLVRSEQQEIGLTFETLSINDQQPDPETPPATPCLEVSNSNLTVPTSESQPRIRALLVDDNLVNLRVLQLYCKKRGIPHATAVDGDKAVTAYREAVSSGQGRFTVILLDLQMPKCDGIEACKEIRAYEQDNNLPRSVVLMITGQDSVADRRKSLAAGVDDYYVKPMSIRKLDQVIAQFFPLSPP